MTDWADEKVKEWIRSQQPFNFIHMELHLATLLREVQEDYAKQGFYDLQAKERASLLAEVRRVVESERQTVQNNDAWAGVCDSILSRLEKL